MKPIDLVKGQVYAHKETGEKLEFQYMGTTGKAIVCEEGDSGGGMQSSWVIDPCLLTHINKGKKKMISAKDVSEFTVVETTEIIRNGDEYKYTIGPDHDGLGLIELIYYEKDSKDNWDEVQRTSMSPQDAFMIGHKLVDHAERVTEGGILKGLKKDGYKIINHSKNMESEDDL